MIGVNLSGAELGKGSRYGYDYIYPSKAELAFYAERGVELVRLPFKWERMQTKLGGELNPAELARMQKFLADAESLGVKVILDLHNYGRYNGQVVGSAAVTTEQFADFWTKMAAAVGGSPALAGYDLMNEPHDMTGTPWKTSVQAAVDAIRTVDTAHKIYVEGQGWASARHWSASNEDLLVNDPANKIVYQAHIYFDDNSSGTYDESYEGELAYASVGADRVRDFVEWLDRHGVEGFIGEFAVPDNDPRWLEVLSNFLDTMEEVGLDGTYWGAGAWMGDYKLGLKKSDGSQRSQMEVLQRFLGATKADVVQGTAGADKLQGSRGDDRILAGAGDDLIASSSGSDLIDGGTGVDQVSYARSLRATTVDLAAHRQWVNGAAEDWLFGVENVAGSRYADQLGGDGQANQLSGNDGDDRLAGMGGADTLDGGSGRDTVDYSASARGVYVDLFRSTQTGGDAEGDVIRLVEDVVGSAGDDTLGGDKGSNQLFGGAGDDLFLASNGGTDLYDGGDGVDTYDMGAANNVAGLSLADGGNKWLQLKNIENLLGTDGNNTLRGDGGANLLVGRGGVDVLEGLDGADTLDGGAGNDKLTGGAGRDFLIGGAGADLFIFAAGDLGGGRETIADFVRAEADKIDLSRLDANTGLAGDQKFAWVGAAAFSGKAGELHAVATAGGWEVQGDWNGDRIADFSILVKASGALAATDFIL